MCFLDLEKGKKGKNKRERERERERVFLIGSEFRGKILLFAGFLWYICAVQLTALFRRTVDWKSVRESLPFE